MKNFVALLLGLIADLARCSAEESEKRYRAFVAERAEQVDWQSESGLRLQMHHDQYQLRTLLTLYNNYVTGR